MIWGKTNPVLLLTVLHGVFCDGIFGLKCRPETYPCGETVTIVCTLTHPLEKMTLIYQALWLNSTSLTKGKMSTDDNKISIEWTEDKVKVIVSKVTFSDTLKYKLYLTAATGNHVEPITINVSGTCTPEISKNIETNELECEAESEKNASIVWMDHHRRLYQATRTREPQQLNTGFKLWSALKLTDEITDDHHICCSVSYPKEACFPNTSAMKITSRSTNFLRSVFFILLAVASVAALIGYLIKRRRSLLRENRPNPPLLQPPSV